MKKLLIRNQTTSESSMSKLFSMDRSGQKSPVFMRALLSVTLLAPLAFTSCGKKEGSSADGPAGGGSPETGTSASTSTSTSSSTSSQTGASSTSNAATTLLNSLAAAVPGNLALTAFPAATSSSLQLDGADDEVQVGEPEGWEGEVYLDDDGLHLIQEVSANANKTIEAEVKENMQVLQGKADSCLPKSYTQAYSAPTEETCYEFDQDMIYGATTQSGSTAKIKGTKDGKNAKGEACLVSFARSQILKVKDPLDRAQAILNAALCQASKDEKAAAKAQGKEESTVDLLPAKVGDTLNLSQYLKNAMQKASKTKDVVSSIKMTRLADVGGQAVYQSIFNMSDEQGNTRFFTLNHSPKDKTNEEYNGVLYFAIKPPVGKADPQAGPGAQAGFTYYVSISYARTKDAATGQATTSYEARTARFKNGVDPIEATGVLNFNAGADFSVATSSTNYGRYKNPGGVYYNQDNEAASGFTYITFANTEDKDGKSVEQQLAFWQNPGSSYTENARGMVFSAKPNASGLLEGCANSGSASVDMSKGISIRRMLNEGATDTSISLTPRGFYHPFMNTETGGPQSSTVTTNGTGEYKYKKVSSQLTNEWVALKSTAPEAVDFVTKQVGAVFTSQCFKQNSSGLYEIDTAKTAGADGFDLIKSTDAKVISAPKPPEVKLQKDGKDKIDFKPAEITQISKSES